MLKPRWEIMMRYSLLTALAAVAACGGDSTEPTALPPTNENTIAFIVLAQSGAFDYGPGEFSAVPSNGSTHSIVANSPCFLGGTSSVQGTGRYTSFGNPSEPSFLYQDGVWMMSLINCQDFTREFVGGPEIPYTYSATGLAVKFSTGGGGLSRWTTQIEMKGTISYTVNGSTTTCAVDADFSLWDLALKSELSSGTFCGRLIWYE